MSCGKNYPYVSGNNLVLNRCTSLPIYTNLPDGTISINPMFNQLWSAFRPPLQRVIGSDCGQVEVFDMPPIPTVVFTATVDPVSKFMNMKRVTPGKPKDSIIINQGIALDYFSASNNEPWIKFNWQLTMKAKSVSIYYLPASISSIGDPAPIFLKLFVDEDSNLTRYFDKREGTVTVKPYGLLFFFVEAPEGTAMTLRATAVTPTGLISPCTLPPVVNLDFTYNCVDYSIPLYTTRLTSGGTKYVITPTPEWQAIADLIAETFMITTKPPPLAPITPPGLQRVESVKFVLGNNKFLNMQYVETNGGNYLQTAFQDFSVVPDAVIPVLNFLDLDFGGNPTQIRQALTDKNENINASYAYQSMQMITSDIKRGDFGYFPINIIPVTVSKLSLEYNFTNLPVPGNDQWRIGIFVKNSNVWTFLGDLTYGNGGNSFVDRVAELSNIRTINLRYYNNSNPSIPPPTEPNYPTFKLTATYFLDVDVFRDIN